MFTLGSSWTSDFTQNTLLFIWYAWHCFMQHLMMSEEESLCSLTLSFLPLLCLGCVLFLLPLSVFDFLRQISHFLLSLPHTPPCCVISESWLSCSEVLKRMIFKHTYIIYLYMRSCDLLPVSYRSISEAGNWCWIIKPGSHLVFQFIPKGLDGVEIGPLCRSFKSFHTDLVKTFIHRPSRWCYL